MSDNIEEIKSVAKIFADAYNDRNKSTFAWTSDDICFEPGEPYDFLLKNENQNSLGVQVTRSCSDPKREYVKPNKTSIVINKLDRSLKNNNVKGLHIYINFHNPPFKKEEIENLTYWLEFIIREKGNDDETLFNWEHKFDEYINTVAKYISEIKIYKDPSEKITFSFSWNKISAPEPWIGADITVPRAIIDKQNHYLKNKINISEIILVVISEPFPISDTEYYISEIANTIIDCKFKEIWIVDNFGNYKKAVKVK